MFEQISAGLVIFCSLCAVEILSFSQVLLFVRGLGIVCELGSIGGSRECCLLIYDGDTRIFEWHSSWLIFEHISAGLVAFSPLCAVEVTLFSPESQGSLRGLSVFCNLGSINRPRKSSLHVHHRESGVLEQCSGRGVDSTCGHASRHVQRQVRPYSVCSSALIPSRGRRARVPPNRCCISTSGVGADPSVCVKVC
jgi:hypothetical protein